jgi:hypothetical protein
MTNTIRSKASKLALNASKLALNDLASQVRTATVTLTPAQMATLHTTAIEIVPPQPKGTAIVLIAATFVRNTGADYTNVNLNLNENLA